MTTKPRLFSRFNESQAFAVRHLSTSALAATLFVATGGIGVDYATGGTFFTKAASTAAALAGANRERQFAPFPEPPPRAAQAPSGTFCKSDDAGSEPTANAAVHDHC